MCVIHFFVKFGLVSKVLFLETQRFLINFKQFSEKNRYSLVDEFAISSLYVDGTRNRKKLRRI